MRSRSVFALLVPAATAVLIVGAVSGCAPATPSGNPTNGGSSASSTPSGAASNTATPTATPVPFPANLGALPANVLFRITAQGVQPDGSTVDLVQTVYAPTGTNSADTSLLNAQCNGNGFTPWQQLVHSPQSFVVSVSTATVDPTTPNFNTKATIAAYFNPGIVAFSGDYAEAQADCADGYFKTIPGTVRGVAPVPANNPALGGSGWAVADTTYGFFGDANDPSDPNGGGGDTVVKNCAVQVSAAALAAAPKLSSWPTQTYHLGTSCQYKS